MPILFVHRQNVWKAPSENIYPPQRAAISAAILVGKADAQPPQELTSTDTIELRAEQARTFAYDQTVAKFLLSGYCCTETGCGRADADRVPYSASVSQTRQRTKGDSDSSREEDR